MEQSNNITEVDLNENTIIILDREHDPQCLRFLEVIYISLKQPSINIQKENIQVLPRLNRWTNQQADQAEDS